MQMEAVFWANYSTFTGENIGIDFLGVLGFRRYLDRYFGVGVTKLHEAYSAEGITHWIFEASNGKVYDSISLKHQPLFDAHCAIFSFYYQLLLSGVLPQNGLTRVTCHLDYIGNLIEIYSSLAVVLSDVAFRKYIYGYEPWRRFGRYITGLSYVEKAWQNVAILEGMRVAARGRRTHQLFKP